MSALASCDCCNAPMVNASHYSADSCAFGDTDACVICSSQTAPGLFQPDSGRLEEEILELAAFADDIRVGVRIAALSAELDAAYAREAPLTHERDDARMTTREGVTLDLRTPWSTP